MKVIPRGLGCFYRPHCSYMGLFDEDCESWSELSLEISKIILIEFIPECGKINEIQHVVYRLKIHNTIRIQINNNEFK